MTVAIALLVWLILPDRSGTQLASPVTMHPSFAQLPEYVDKVIGGTFRSPPEGDQETILPFIKGDQDPTTMRPSPLRQLSETFDRWAGKPKDVDPGDVPFVTQ